MLEMPVMCVGMGLIAILSHTDQMKLVAKLTKKELGDRSTFGCSFIVSVIRLASSHTGY